MSTTTQQNEGGPNGYRKAPVGPLPRRWYTVGEVAEMLGFSASKVRTLVISGDLKSLKEGRSRRILPVWVDEYIARRAAEAEAEANWPFETEDDWP